MPEGVISRIAGPVMTAKGMKGSLMYEVVRVGEQKLIGEIIELAGDTATIQVYEETAGIAPGQKVLGTGLQLSVEDVTRQLAAVEKNLRGHVHSLLKQAEGHVQRCRILVPELVCEGVRGSEHFTCASRDERPPRH